jgi:hypothetical protein
MKNSMVIKMQVYRMILRLYNLVDQVGFTILFGKSMILQFLILRFAILPFEFRCHLGSLF